MRKFKEPPQIRDWIVELIEWRKEQAKGLPPLPIPEWMSEMLASEAGAKVKSIDGVRLPVIPDSRNSGVTNGLKESLDSQPETR